MKIEQNLWSINKLIKQRDSINLNPAWQRGPTWRQNRQALLIDSILRGMDIPKVYLRKRQPGGSHTHDAVDGQQRLRAIWAFADGDLSLGDVSDHPPINGVKVAGLGYKDLPKALHDQFIDFEISVAQIVNSSATDITDLFSRLQMGVALNPAELRNAILSPLRHQIDALTTSHPFFAECKIPEARYKRQDFVTHAIAMAAYGTDRDIKAAQLKSMVREFTHDRAEEILELSSAVSDALDVLTEVNRKRNFSITQKWIFVDLCYLIMQVHKKGSQVNPSRLALKFGEFEERRREFTSSPEQLIRSRNAGSLDRHLYEYINAFRTQGAVKQNLVKRHRALKAHCLRIEVSR